MIVFRPERILAAVLVAVSIAGCAGSRNSSSVVPGVQGTAGALSPKTLATGSSTPSSSPQPAGPGTYVHGTGTPAFPTALTSAPVYQDTQSGIVSQTDPTGTYTNFYDGSGSFTHQVDTAQQAANGMPIIRDSEANGTVASMQMPDLNTQASSGSFTVGDFSYTLDGVGTAHGSLGGRSATVLVDDGQQTGTMTSQDGTTFALNLAPTASSAPTLSAKLRKAAGAHSAASGNGRHTSATDACVRARWLLALAVLALALVIAGAAAICYGAVTPMQWYYCYRALATIAGFTAAVAVAIINMRKACASPTPTATATATATPTTPSTATPTATTTPSGGGTPTATPTASPTNSVAPRGALSGAPA